MCVIDMLHVTDSYAYHICLFGCRLLTYFSFMPYLKLKLFSLIVTKVASLHSQLLYAHVNTSVSFRLNSIC